MYDIEMLPRELEKAAKFLAKTSHITRISPDDDRPRRQIARAAFEQDFELVAEVVDQILALENGQKSVIRALNNCGKIQHLAVLHFANTLYLRILPYLSQEQHALRLANLLRAFHNLGVEDVAPFWIEARDMAEKWQSDVDEDAYAVCAASDETVHGATRAMLMLEWTASILRIDPSSERLISEIEPFRHMLSSKSAIKTLKNTFYAQNAHWTQKAAALYLLLGNRAMRLEAAQKFIDQARQSFDLDAMLAIEQLSIAVEYDASFVAEDRLVSNRAKIAIEKVGNFRRIPLQELAETRNDALNGIADLPRERLELLELLEVNDDNDPLLIATFFAFIDMDALAFWAKALSKQGILDETIRAAFEQPLETIPYLNNFALQLTHFVEDKYPHATHLADLWLHASEQRNPDLLREAADKIVAFLNETTH